MPVFIKNSGSWQNIVPQIKDGGTWKTPSQMYIKDNGVWKPLFSDDDGGGSLSGPYLYVGSGTGSSTELHQIDTSDMSFVNSITSYENEILKIDSSSSNIYTGDGYGNIDKIDASNMTIADSHAGSGDAAWAISYGNDGYIYEITNNGAINKIDPSNMSQVNTYSTGTTGRSIVYGGDGYVYAGNSGGDIYKLDPSDMSLVTSASVASGSINDIIYAVDVHGYLIACNSEYPGTVDKIDPADLSVVGAYTGFGDYVWEVVHSDGFIYAAGYQSDGVHKIDISDMSGSGTYTGHGTSSFSSITAITIDSSGYFYSGGDDEEVHKVDKNTMSFDSKYTATSGAVESLHFA